MHINCVFCKSISSRSVIVEFLHLDLTCIVDFHLCVPSDHRCSGGDAQEGERAGGSQEEAGHDPTATVQVLAVRAQRGWTGSVSCITD